MTLTFKLGLDRMKLNWCARDIYIKGYSVQKLLFEHTHTHTLKRLLSLDH